MIGDGNTEGTRGGKTEVERQGARRGEDERMQWMIDEKFTMIFCVGLRNNTGDARNGGITTTKVREDAEEQLLTKHAIYY